MYLLVLDAVNISRHDQLGEVSSGVANWSIPERKVGPLGISWAGIYHPLACDFSFPMKHHKMQYASDHADNGSVAPWRIEEI